MELQPNADSSLTWFVASGHLYSQYTDAAYRTSHGPVKYEDLMKIVSFIFPTAKMKKLKKYPVVCGVRFFAQPGVLRFGV